MMPRFMFPESMVTISRFTITGWALDGFLPIFWYEDPQASVLQALWSLLPEVAVLVGFAPVALFIARRLARRWEAIGALSTEY